MPKQERQNKMSLSLNDYEDVAQEEEQSKKAEEQAVVAAAPAPAAISGIQPPAQNNGLNVPGLINQSWQGIKPYLNPLHYNDNGPQDYTNVDIPTSVVHGLGEGAVGLGLANRLKRAVSGENAQYAEQNKLAREKFEYAKAQNALNQQQVEQKVTAQAAGNPLAEPNGRIEPTLNQAPVAPPVQAQAPVQAPAVPTAEEIRYQAFQEDQRRKNELHEKKLAAIEAKNAEGKSQKTTASGGISPEDRQMLQSSEKAKMDKAISAEQKAVAPKGAAVPNVQPATPIASQQTPTSVVEAQATGPSIKTPQEIVKSTSPEKFVLPISSNPAETALTKEQTSARGWMANQHGGLNKYYEAVQNVFGGVPPSYTSEAGQKAIGKEAHQVMMDWRKANIEGPKVNLTHDMKKVMKGAGGLAILASIPGFAEAAQKKDYGKMSDIASDFFVLPFAQSRGLNENESQELAKRQYEGTVGAGRGIAPPSSYKQP
jgi:hypothetical protein